MTDRDELREKVARAIDGALDDALHDYWSNDTDTLPRDTLADAVLALLPTWEQVGVRDADGRLHETLNLWRGDTPVYIVREAE